MSSGACNFTFTSQPGAPGKKLDELSVKTEDLEVDVYLDGPRVVRIVAPSANAEIVRQ